MKYNVYFEQFEYQVTLQESSNAIVCSDGCYTYDKLNKLANQIAHTLIEAGIESKKQSIVGLFFSSGHNYVASLLGVAKAGAAFLPLSPDLPDDRLAGYIKKADCSYLITDRNHVPALQKVIDSISSSAQIVTLDQCLEQTKQGNPGIAVGPADGCYVMFTSGSTGQPKAILGQQRGLSHFLRWELETLQLDSTVRSSWLAPVSFDVSLRDILVPLMAGGTLFWPDENTRMQPHRLVTWLQENKINLMHCVPTVLRLLTNALQESTTTLPAFPDMRFILIAGEPLFGFDIEKWRNNAGSNHELINLYGPSETTLAKLYYRIKQVPTNLQQVIPIGIPLPHASVVILRDGTECTVGEIGEIYLRTPHRSLGYLNDPELTASAFIQNPLNLNSEDILYKTGDMGRLLEDGNVECLGREDNQIKINGIRIEYAEIENALRSVPGIHHCACSLHYFSDQRTLLVAYYTRSDNSTEPLELSEIRNQLDTLLPVVMHPQRFILLKNIPETISGKVNRKALPKPDELYYENSDFNQPETKTEKSLASIWSELLGIKLVGIDTSFSTLGGDSLRAIKVLMKIYQTFHVEISLGDFFQNNTIRNIGKILDKVKLEQTNEIIEKLPEADSYDVSPSQKRLWRLHQMGIAPDAYNLPMAYYISGQLEVEIFKEAFDILVDRHEALRTIFKDDNGTIRQVVLPKLNWQLEIDDIQFNENNNVRINNLVKLNAEYNFNLSAGPLFRLSLIKLPKENDTGLERYLLIFNVHHIISDVWSLTIMVRELSHLYESLKLKTSPTLSALRIQQRDITSWQEKYLNSEKGKNDATYWQNHFHNVPVPLDLPTDRSRPAVQTFNGKTIRKVLPLETSDLLREFANTEKVTLFVVLNTLTKILLMRYSGQNDIVTGSPVAGRNHYEMENQIGYFVNIIALNDTFNSEDNFKISLKKSNSTISEALIHQQYPFDSLVESLNLMRDMSRSPLFDVMVVVDTFDSFDLNLHGLEIKKFTEENNWNFSRYDLVFHFQTEAGQIILDINYNSDLFDYDRAIKLSNHFENLTKSALLSPNSPIGKLNLLSKSELEIIKLFSVGPSSVKNNFTISDLLKLVCDKNEQNLAVQQGHSSITYKNLLQYSDFLAYKLMKDYGVELGDRITVIAHRNIESVVCMLAIMRAGAIYVPIDPANPKGRIAGLIKKARSNLILLVSSSDFDLIENCNIPHFLINENSYIGEYGNDIKFPNITINDAAYLIFTSGSTGEPKGVIVSHGGFINMSLYQIDVFKIDTSDRVLQFASPSFDASLANMFMALFAGASIILPSKNSIESKDNFLEFLQLSQSTVVTLPTSFLRALNKDSLHSVRVLVTAGEAAPVEELAYYAESMNVFNAYGPTEFSVCASVYSVKSQDGSLQRIPIGKPISNSKIFILDSTGNFCPLGVPGEIFLAGTGLSLGYFDDIELTQSKFIFLDQLNEYVYKTGDIGCWLEDGSVDIFGRNDDQIKISGHRIEIGEIEHALRDLPGIADATVTSILRSDKTLSLAAYYCLVPSVEIWPSVAEFFVYDDVVYSSMANDQRRNRMYRESFERHLKGKVVVDIGTGPFAILSRIAIDAGAKRVYAIDLLESTANKARQTVSELGLSDKIIVLQGDARSIQLPELVDFCISEIVGGIGGSEGAADIINQSRKLLKFPHQILPQRSVTHIAAVSLESGSWEKGFSNVAAHYVEKIFSEVGAPFDLRLCIKNFPNSALISSQGILEDLDFTNNVALESEHTECLIINKASSLTGFLVWLQLHIDSISSVDILENPDSWLPVYIPIDPNNIKLNIDDQLHLNIKRKLSKNLLNPDFIISGFIERDGEKIQNINCNSLHFGEGYRQTPFYQILFANNDIPKIDNLDSQAVRRSLAERLPSYAIPAFLISLDALPLNVNGKVDKKALPNPLSNNNIESLDNSVNPLEKIVLQVWRDVLGRQDIGVHDDFFMLGGDSMRAIQMISKFNLLGLRSEIRHIFQNPTVSKLTNVIQNTVHITDQSPVIGEVPLTPIQSWFFEQMKDSLNHFHQAVCLRSKHPIELEPLKKAFTSVWIHHDALRAKFSMNSGSQVFADPGDVPSITVIQSADNENFKDYENNVYHHTNIEEGHLFSALLISSNNRQELFLIAHHLVVDKVSWGIIIEDFSSSYESALKGQTPVLPLKSDSYRDHAVRIKNLSNLSDWSDMSIYCRNIAAPLPAFFDRTDGSIRRGGDMLVTSKFVEMKATSELLDCIKGSNGINLQEILLLSLGMAIHRVIGQSNTLITLESHGRAWPENLNCQLNSLNLSRTVGWFTVHYPYMLDLHPNLSINDQLSHVKHSLDSIPDQGWSFGIVEPIIRAQNSSNPVTGQVGFNYLGNMSSKSENNRFEVIWETEGDTVGSNSQSPHPLDLLSYIEDNQIILHLAYDKISVKKELADDLLASILSNLSEIRDGILLGNKNIAFTTNNFIYKGLDDSDIDDLLS